VTIQMNDLLFIIFSTIEALTVFTISLSLFRYNVLKYFKQIAPISFIMALLSYAIWFETSLSDYIPIISLVLFIFFIFHTLEISLFGAAIVAIIGSGLTLLLQTLYLQVLQYFGIITVSSVQNAGGDYFLLSLITSATGLAASFLLYRTGYGFSFPLNQFKLKWENWLVLIISIVTLLFLSILHMLKHELYLVNIVVILIIMFLIYYAWRKERMQW